MQHDIELTAALERYARALPHGGRRALSISPPPVQAPEALMKAPDHQIELNRGDDVARACKLAKPGTRILLPDGTYKGTWYLENAAGGGTPDKPIEIVAKNPGKVVVDPTRTKDDPEGNAKVATNGVLSFGLRFKRRLHIHDDARGSSILACWFEGPQGIYIARTQHYLIGYCSFSGRARKGQKDDHIVFNIPDGAKAPMPKHGRVFRCRFSDPNLNQTGIEAHHIYIGKRAQDRHVEGLWIHHNRMAKSGRRRSVYAKDACGIVGNTIVMRDGSALFRGGRDGLAAGNVIAGARDIHVDGPNHTLICNRLSASLDTQIQAGHKSSSGANYRPAHGTCAIHNDGDLVLGYVAKKGRLLKPVQNVTIYRGRGSIIRVSKAWDAKTCKIMDGMPEGFEPIEPREIGEGEVGPDAWPGDAPVKMRGAIPGIRDVDGDFAFGDEVGDDYDWYCGPEED